ncbi:MAG: matrixin family metalloprotease [Kofleriaceae bacterium]
MGPLIILLSVTFELQVHVVDGVVDQAWIDKQVAMANTLFAPVDASFEVAGQVTLDDSAKHVVTRDDRNALAKLVDDNKIHVFVIDKLENVDENKPVHGVTWRGGGKKYIIIGSDSMERVLAHELGHVFGLPHSKYPISIMNKTKREKPPIEDRRFSDEEQAKMKPVIEKLAKQLATKLLH